MYIYIYVIKCTVTQCNVIYRLTFVRVRNMMLCSTSLYFVFISASYATLYMFKCQHVIHICIDICTHPYLHLYLYLHHYIYIHIHQYHAISLYLLNPIYHTGTSICSTTGPPNCQAQALPSRNHLSRAVPAGGSSWSPESPSASDASAGDVPSFAEDFFVLLQSSFETLVDVKSM